MNDEHRHPDRRLENRLQAIMDGANESASIAVNDVFGSYEHIVAPVVRKVLLELAGHPESRRREHGSYWSPEELRDLADLMLDQEYADTIECEHVEEDAGYSASWCGEEPRRGDWFCSRHREEVDRELYGREDEPQPGTLVVGLLVDGPQVGGQLKGYEGRWAVISTDGEERRVRRDTVQDAQVTVREMGQAR